jgi:hypothetical protein
VQPTSAALEVHQIEQLLMRGKVGAAALCVALLTVCGGVLQQPLPQHETLHDVFAQSAVNPVRSSDHLPPATNRFHLLTMMALPMKAASPVFYNGVNIRDYATVQQILATSEMNRRWYCSLHGYNCSFVQQQDKRAASRGGGWAKIAWLIDHINATLNNGTDSSASSWFWTLDADAFIMNGTIRLDDVVAAAWRDHAYQELDVIITMDCNGLNSGSMFVRASQFSLAFLQRVWGLHSYHVRKSTGSRWEQSGIKWLYRLSSTVRKHMAILPQEYINSYTWPCFAAYQPGHFVLHLVDGTKRRFRAYLPQIPIPAGEQRVNASFGVNASIALMANQSFPSWRGRGHAAASLFHHRHHSARAGVKTGRPFHPWHRVGHASKRQDAPLTAAAERQDAPLTAAAEQRRGP